jgi:hypothetical protein
MRMLICLLSLFIFSNNSIWGQNKQVPNYSIIEQNISQKNSNLYYQILLNRFELGDTSFSIEELQHLYFGFQFEEIYNPYTISTYSDSLKLILKKEDEFNNQDYKSIIKYYEFLIKEDPFNIENYKYVNYAYRNLKEGEEEIIKNKIKIKNIIDAIESTGSGLTYDDRMYVINISHEYNYLRHYSFEFLSQKLIETTDYLELKKNEYNVQGFYFDVSASFNSMNKILDIDQLTLPTTKKKKSKSK